MEAWRRKAWAGVLLAAALCGLAGTAPAAVYKYKKDGVWHFTDNAGEVPADQRPAADGPLAPPAGHDLAAQLTAALRPANAIERATLATVAIQSTFGYGTGFFVSADGLILTNRHVIRQDGGGVASEEPAYSERADALERAAAHMQAEQARLEGARAELADYRRYIDIQTDPSTRSFHEERYAKDQADFARWEQMVREKHQELDAARVHFEAAQVQQRLDAGLANLSSHFTVYLADNTELYAYLVEISSEHDLALVKIDGYITPFIEAGRPEALAQGDPVYAIGNPVKLRNSVTSGVLSGFQGPFLKTNAQIYPGNSGGPLVTAQGRVVGVNTFKQLTRNYEGLGFAIAIGVARQTFDAF